MIIIWGTRTRKKDVSSGQFYCPRCGTERYYTHKRVVKYFTLFFIPLIPLNTVGEYVECQGCHQAFKPEVRDYAPPSQADQFVRALVADLESGTPLQMLHRKLINAGIESEPAKVALAAAIAQSGNPEDLKLCPECELLYLNTVSRCSICGTNLIEMPGSKAEPAEQPPEEQEGTDVDGEYSISAPTKLQAEPAGPEEGEQTGTSRNRRGCATVLLIGIGVLMIGALVVLFNIFGGQNKTQYTALTPQSTKRSLVASTATPREAAPTAAAPERETVTFSRDPRSYVAEQIDMPDGYTRDSSDSWETSTGAVQAYTVVYAGEGDPFAEEAEFVQFAVLVCETEWAARMAFDSFKEEEPGLEPFRFPVKDTDESAAYLQTETIEEMPTTSLHVIFRRTNAVGAVTVGWVGEESTALNLSEVRRYVDLALDKLED